MQPPVWIADYIGREYDDLSWNCWTLCRELATKHLNASEWPAYDFMTPEDRQGVSRLMSSEASQYWHEVLSAAQFQQGERGEALGDVAVLRYGAWASHAALVVAPNKMVHVDKTTPTCIVEMRNQSWLDRVAGVFRWTP